MAKPGTVQEKGSRGNEVAGVVRAKGRANSGNGGIHDLRSWARGGWKAGQKKRIKKKTSHYRYQGEKSIQAMGKKREIITRKKENTWPASPGETQVTESVKGVEV